MFHRPHLPSSPAHREPPPDQSTALLALQAAQAAAATFADASRAAATRRAYAADWADFAMWCRNNLLVPLPARPETLAVYLAERAGTLKVSTLRRRLAGIAAMHQGAGHRLELRHPQLRQVWRGIRRTLGTASATKVPLLPDQLRRIVALLPKTLAGQRDKAILLLGFAGAFRRSELVALRVEDIAHHAQGLCVSIRRGKEDQDGAGSTRAIPRSESEETCPVRAVQAWLCAARLADGPLFRPIDRFGRLQDGALAPRAVARIVKKAVAAAARAEGLPEAAVAARVAAVAGHSLRSGLVTAALLNGAQEAAVMRQTGHKSRRSLHQYIRLATLFDDNVATKTGL